MKIGSTKLIVTVLLAGALQLVAGTGGALAAGKPESGVAGNGRAKPHTVETIAKTMQPHWVWINDMNLWSMPDGRAVLLDGDSGRVLGMLNTGYSFNALALPSGGREIYSAETYYSRYTRGKRTDIVDIYDPHKLVPIAEITIPDKRESTIPGLYDSSITDNNRFMAVFNLTPASSLSIVDLKKRRFVQEIQTPGCALAYPAGKRRFFSLCPDGSLFMVTLDDSGKEKSRFKSKPFFQMSKDPILENGVRDGDTWLFTSVLGYVCPVTIKAGKVSFGARWSLLSKQERADDWRIGGMQPAALQRARGRLYVLVHQGGFYTYRKPGKRIWVYDIHTHKRIATMQLQMSTNSIAVTQDAHPLLFALEADNPVLDVFDATTGAFQRSVDKVGTTPALLEVKP